MSTAYTRPERFFAVISEDDDLYRDIIVDHPQRPRCHGILDQPTHSHQGFNPLCGDEIEIHLDIGDDCIRQIRFQGSGCSISQAAASMLSEQLQGKSLPEAQKIAHDFRTWMMDRQAPQCPEGLGDLEALAGVRNYPVRIKCALLSSSTFEQALKGS